MNKIYYFAILALVFTFSLNFISASSFGYNYLDNQVTGSINNSYTNINNTYINQTVNATVNATQFSSNDPITLDTFWLTSFLNNIYCKLTGCTMSGSISNVSSIGLNTEYVPTGSESIGTSYWDNISGTVSTKLSNEMTLQNGEELFFYGKANGNINNGQVCEYGGVQGDHVLFKTGNNTEIANSPFLFSGIATETFTNGNFGRCTWFGRINGIYTRNWNGTAWNYWSAGDELFWDNTNGSQLTNVAPYAPQIKIQVGFVEKAMTGSAENGIIYISPEYGNKLQNLDDVDGYPLNTTGQFYVWNQTRQVFDSNFNINDYVKTTSINVSNYVPYSGATSNVNLTGKSLVGTTNVYLNGSLRTYDNSGTNLNYTEIKYSSGEGVITTSFGPFSFSPKSGLFYQYTNGVDSIFGQYNSTGSIRNLISSNGITYFRGGNVGIGTDTPTSKLNIYRDNTTSDANLELTGDKIYPSLVSSSASDNAFHGTFFNMYRARGTQSSKTSVQAGDSISSYDNYAFNGSSNLKALQFKGLVEQVNTSNGDIGGYWAFATSNAKTGENDVERMRINQEGNVGIGTTTPTSKLHVVDINTDPSTASYGVRVGSIKSSATTDATQSTGMLVSFSQVGAGNYTSTTSSISGSNYFSGTGTVASQNALWFLVGTTGNDTGSVTSRTGVRVQAFSTSNKSVGSSYGLYVNNMAAYNYPNNTYGVYVDSSTTAVGINKWGLLINDQSGATNNYAIQTGAGKVRFGDDVLVQGNNKKLYFGSSSSSSIYYDGTNLNINPKEVGSGKTNNLGGMTIGNSTGNITIDEQGNLMLNGEATQWDDMTIPINTGKTVGSTNVPSFEVFRNGTYAYAFVADDQIFATQQMSHSYATGTTIYQHTHIVPSTTNTGNVTICVEWTKSDIYGVFPTTTTSCGTAYMNGTAMQHILALDGNIGNFTGLSGIINARIFRNTTTIGSAYADKVFILAYDLHYQKNSLGSNTELVK